MECGELQKPLAFYMKQVQAPGFYDTMGMPIDTCVLEYDEQTSKIAGNNKPTERISEAERFARDTYAEAANKHGTIIVDEELFGAADIVAVNVEDWLAITYKMSSADKEGTKRQHFNRARKIMLEVKKILFKKEIDGKEYYCLVPSEDGYEAGILKNIHQRGKR